MKKLQLDDKLNFEEEPVEVMDHEIKKLKRSRIPIIKIGISAMVIENKVKTLTITTFLFQPSKSSMPLHSGTNYFPTSSESSPFNSSENSTDNMIQPVSSSFYNNPCLKDVQAFIAKEFSISSLDLITPPAILTPSSILELQKEHIGQRDKISFARLRISDLEITLEDIQDRHQLYMKNLMEHTSIPPKRMSTSEAPDLTHTTIKELVAHSITVILKAQAAMMESTNNPNSEPRKTSVARICTYEKFTSYQLFYFNGTDGAVGLIRWFKWTESIFSRSKCAEEDKVRFAVSTLTKEALSWWIQSIGIEEAYKITWSELKRLLIEKYCPQTEIKKMEEAITMTQKLIKHVRKHNSVQETNNHKRKFNNEGNTTDNNNNYQNNYNNNNRDNHYHQQQNRKQGAFKIYTATNGYTGNRPLCERCTLHHIGPCTVKCRTCNRVGHLTKNCRNKTTRNNLQTVSVTCNACGKKGHYANQCSKANNRATGKHT
ncbi:reverse transcriptase domain-containing protein [Tanacetum coccineum]